jgi:hypothetical protein
MFFSTTKWNSDVVSSPVNGIDLLTTYTLTIPPTALILETRLIKYIPPVYPLDGRRAKYFPTKIIYYCPFFGLPILTISSKKHPDIPQYVEYRVFNGIFTPDDFLSERKFPMKRKSWGRAVITYLLWLYKAGKTQEAYNAAETYLSWQTRRFA